ncbi:acyltransferase family-domain-containing protein [Pseudoneurospora amorphoporcata]|uniref:Acyltransferase family-domain-containing protein n=1 Tax=Pseudoneurospora amorphoporcata TaxID=241081 RepID=A0AAN6SJX2_9PEZI|nr:acyltransferase family-domain-containing protein [Pseudoneurospora amorphoporcata]
MHNLAPEKTSNVGRDLDTDNALFHDVESNPGHGKQELGTAQRPRRRHSGIFGWLPSLDIDFLSRNPRHYVSHSIRPLFLRSAFFLLPSFLQSRIQGRTPFGPEPQGNQKKGGQRGEKPRLLSPTSYLDGMRGIAAFSVFLCHYSYTCFVIAEGWGSGGSNYYFLKLPFIRLFYSGPPMVCIFFVISGYALSLKPLKLIHSISSRSSSAITSAARTKKHEHNNYSKLLETLSSLVFRRGLRLFLPPAISTFLIVLLLRLGVYEWNRSFASDAEFLRNVQEIHYTRFDSATEQFVDWGYAVLNFVHLWDWDAFAGSTGIDVHLWTIPVEFRASMVLFLTILGTARLRGGVRMGVVLGWCVFAFLWERWEMCLFWMGMVLAEGDVVRDMAAKREEGRREGELPESSGGGILPVVEPVTLARMGDVMLIPQQGPKRSRRHPQPRQGAIEMSPDIYIVGSEDEASHSSTYPHSSNHPSSTSSRPSTSPAGNTILPIVLLIISLYLLSQPDINSHLTPGWITLTSLIPHWWTEHYRFYQSIGAVILVYAVSRHPSSSPSSSSASSASGSDTAPILSQYLNPKILFESAIAQYLGKISYAIYLVHGPVLHTLGYTVMKFTWTRVTGTETDGHYITGFLLASLAVVPLVVWVADVFWRGVDEPVVKFARRVEERVVFGC